MPYRSFGDENPYCWLGMGSRIVGWDGSRIVAWRGEPYRWLGWGSRSLGGDGKARSLVGDGERDCAARTLCERWEGMEFLGGGAIVFWGVFGGRPYRVLGRFWVEARSFGGDGVFGERRDRLEGMEFLGERRDRWLGRGAIFCWG